MLTAGAALIGILVGAVATAALLIGLSRSRVRAAAAERGRILAGAEREAEAVRREAQVEAREQAVQLRSEIEAEVQNRRLEIAKIEERILQKEEEFAAKLTDLERQEQGLGDREVHVKALQEELKEAKGAELAALERISGLTANEALDAVEPEAARARRIVASRGASPKTARYLYGKGFSQDAVSAVVAEREGDELG